MKKLILLFVYASVITSCSSDAEITTGSIYGVVMEMDSAEPMRSVGVELYGYDSNIDSYKPLIRKTVTYDDGHYEFDNIEPGEYVLQVVCEGYRMYEFGQIISEYNILVEAGKIARADLQIRKEDNGLTVTTQSANVVGSSVILSGKYNRRYTNYPDPDEVGFRYSSSSQLNQHSPSVTAEMSYNISATIHDLEKGKYYYQAYAKNRYGTSYGNILSFEITGFPILQTLEPSNIQTTSVTLNGLIKYEGNPKYSERGFIISSIKTTPTIDDKDDETSKIVVPGDSQDFSATISLSQEANYYVRAYAKSDYYKTVYGEVIEFSNKSYYTIDSEGLMVHKYDISSGVDWYTAKNICDESTKGGFSDWRLPTAGECEGLSKYATQIDIDRSSTRFYWTSREHSQYINIAYIYGFYGNILYEEDKDETHRVRCVRTRTE